MRACRVRLCEDTGSRRPPQKAPSRTVPPTVVYMNNKSHFLLWGPVACTAFVFALVSAGSLHPGLLSLALATVAFAWSPLPVSLAAVIMDEERNGAKLRNVAACKTFLQGEHSVTVRSHLAGWAVPMMALGIVLL